MVGLSAAEKKSPRGNGGMKGKSELPVQKQNSSPKKSSGQKFLFHARRIYFGGAVTARLNPCRSG